MPTYKLKNENVKVELFNNNKKNYDTLNVILMKKTISFLFYIFVKKYAEKLINKSHVYYKFSFVVYWYPLELGGY